MELLALAIWGSLGLGFMGVVLLTYNGPIALLICVALVLIPRLIEKHCASPALAELIQRSKVDPAHTVGWAMFYFILSLVLFVALGHPIASTLVAKHGRSDGWEYAIAWGLCLYLSLPIACAIILFLDRRGCWGPEGFKMPRKRPPQPPRPPKPRKPPVVAAETQPKLNYDPARFARAHTQPASKTAAAAAAAENPAPAPKAAASENPTPAPSWDDEEWPFLYGPPSIPRGVPLKIVWSQDKPRKG